MHQTEVPEPSIEVLCDRSEQLKALAERDAVSPEPIQLWGDSLHTVSRDHC